MHPVLHLLEVLGFYIKPSFTVTARLSVHTEGLISLYLKYEASEDAKTKAEDFLRLCRVKLSRC